MASLESLLDINAAMLNEPFKILRANHAFYLSDTKPFSGNVDRGVQTSPVSNRPDYSYWTNWQIQRQLTFPISPLSFCADTLEQSYFPEKDDSPTSESAVITADPMKITVATCIIRRLLRARAQKRLYARCRDKLQSLRREHPLRLLKHLQRDDAAAFDTRMGYQIIFRLSGPNFPPRIVYKVCPNIPFIYLNQNTSGKHCKFAWAEFNWRLVPGHREKQKERITTAKTSRKQSKLTWIPDHYKF